MTMRRLVLRSLSRFAATNLGVMLGVAVATAVITGALIVGDSMRGTLKQTANQRLGGVDYALIGGDRFFTDQMRPSQQRAAASVIALDGVLATPDGATVVAEVRVYGIDDNGINPYVSTPGPGLGLVNTTLHARLGRPEVGGELILRIPEPSALPQDAALVNASNPPLALRLRTIGVVTPDRGGRFSLRAEQREPLNLFVDRGWLAEQLGVPGRANLLLMRGAPAAITPTLDDLELTLRPAPDGRAELTTPRVLIDASVEQDLAGLPGQRLLTYMANTIALGGNESPYAMVSATNRIGDQQLADDQIAINQWLADDIGASVGDTLTLTYYVPDAGDRLTESQAELTVARIVPLEGVYADRSLTPDFPGLNEARSLRSWDAGPAIDRSRIRDKDEAYWDAHRATPKAFVSLATGQRLWANRFGTLTAVRFDQPIDKAKLLEHIDPAPLGFTPTGVRQQAERAAEGTVDFAQLFLSLSGFIILAAVVLAAALFATTVEQRARQLGTLLSIGLARGQVMRLLLGESALVALAGVVLGVLGGIGYAYAVVQALSGVWSGAVAGTAVQVHLTPTSLVAGPLGAVLVCAAAVVLTLRAVARRPARDLLSGAVGAVSGRPRLPAGLALLAACCFASGACPLVLQAGNASGMKGGLMGFGAGAAVLSSLVLAFYSLLGRRGKARPLGWFGLAIRNLARRRGRTLAAVVTLGCGVFLVLAVSGLRLSASDDPADRRSGTGGFALIVETGQPIHYDLNTAVGRGHYALSEDELAPGSVVPLRVSSGDDASCLNLNQSPTPRLLGADPALLANRQAFTFQKMSGKAGGWGVLSAQAPLQRNTIPAVADTNTAQWALKLAVGDTLTLTDERGQPFTLELVGTLENSILQGSLIISDEHFKRLYPSVSGYRLMLVDPVQAAARDEVAALLSEVLVDEGVTVTPTEQRLAEYNTVQNTYLTIFQALGGLGVVLGALGLGVITARNLMERRSELALLSAVGIGRARVLGMLLIEHGLLLVAGLGIGCASAAVATGSAGGLMGGSIVSASATLGAALLAGSAAVALGLRYAASGRITEALRRE